MVDKGRTNPIRGKTKDLDDDALNRLGYKVIMANKEADGHLESFRLWAIKRLIALA